MAIVIRTLYNNQQWQAPCNDPMKDENCLRCIDPNVKITPPTVSNDGVCAGSCWEQHICTKYRWGCTPKGRTWGKRAYVGMKVFFVFREYRSGLYTLWGHSTVQQIDKEPVVDEYHASGNYIFMHFNQFEALPRDKWVSGLEDRDIVGEKWLQGRHRYIDSAREEYLEQLIAGAKREDVASVNPIVTAIPTQPSTHTSLNISVMHNIDDKLEEIASEEGRQKDEIVREAIAEWLRSRKK